MGFEEDGSEDADEFIGFFVELGEGFLGKFLRDGGSEQAEPTTGFETFVS